MPIAAVIRPGETDFDIEDRVQGALDLPLNERGQQQVQDLAAVLRGRSIQQILSASHDPSRTTAKLLGEALGISVKEVEELNNVDHGLWQGLCIEEIRRKHPKVFKHWNESPETVCPPGGETGQEAAERARKALRRSMKRKDNFAVVCSEPMATLVKCILQHQEPRLPSPCSRGRDGAVEFVEFSRPEAVVVPE